MKKLTVLIPCYNEEKGVAKVIKGVPRKKLENLGYDVEILVVDNNSKDKTSEVAKKAGARVVFQKKQGKRYALEMGFKEAKGDLIAMLDGDNTYPAREIFKLVKEIDGADLIIGTRFYSLWNLPKLFYPHELGFHRVLANKIGAVMGSIILGKGLTDVTTGMRAFKKSVLKKIPKIKAKNLDFECEFTARVITAGLKYKEVQIDTNFREGNSSLNYFVDSFRFLWAMIRGRWD